MAARRANPYGKRLAALAKTIARSKPAKLHAPLFEVFVIVAAAGDARRAATVLDWMYGPRTPSPSDEATALSTGAMDVFCAAAELGDRTNGTPGERREPLGGRVAAAEHAVRARLTRNAYVGKPPTDDAWDKRDGAWRTIDRWRRIQALASADDEAGALDRIEGYLDALAEDARGAGYGDELVLGLDLALRLGREDLATRWVERHGHRFESESFLLETALSIRAVARAIRDGLLRPAIGLDGTALEQALAAVDTAITVAMKAAAAPPKPPPRVQRRRAEADYSQVHLEPSELDPDERAQVHFQKREDSARGMSLFPTRVAIGTPPETAYVDAEITLGGSKSLTGVTQAVSFPLRVRGPLQLNSPTGSGEAEPFHIPSGDYDVLARFSPRKAPRSESASGLRVFTLALSFHAAGSLGAPKTIRLEGA